MSVFCVPELTETAGIYRCVHCGFENSKPRQKPFRKNCTRLAGGLARPPGVGKALHSLLHDRFGVGLKKGCGCNSMVRKMNAWGPVGCREHLDEITDHLLSEARRRKWKIDGRAILSAALAVGNVLASSAVRRNIKDLVLDAIEISERATIIPQP